MPSQPQHPKSSPVITDVSRETFIRTESIMEQYAVTFSRLVDMWMEWNRSVNLFSRKTDPELLKLHIIHSLLLVSETSTPDNNRLVIDAGTGGGLPGLPMAIACPGREFLLVDKVGKKLLAVKDTIRTLGLSNVTVRNCRVEDLVIPDGSVVVSKHAFPVEVLLATLDDKNWSQVALLKGDDVFSEIQADLYENYHISFRSLQRASHPFFEDKYIVLINKERQNRCTHEQQ